MITQAAPIIYLTLTLSLLPVAGCAPAPPLHGSRYQDAKPAPELALRTASGGVFSLASLQGQVVLLYFGYTYCPDICPATLAELKWVEEQLGAQASQLQVLFVSIDPGRDDPETIRIFLERFNQTFVGLSGTEEELEPILAGYGVAAQRDPGDTDNYTMSHTSRVFLIDKSGRLQTNYTFDESRETILADVRSLLER